MKLFQSIKQISRAVALLLALFAITATAAYGQEPLLIKSPQETLEKFAARLIPKGMKLAHPVVEGDFGSAKGNIVILFHEEAEREFTGWVLRPEGSGYKKFVLPEVRLPVSTKILAVFFDNADNDADKELFILCEHISGVGSSPGNITPFYTTYVYDWNNQEFIWLEKVSMDLDAVGHTKTVKGVRKLLREKGY